MNDIPSRSCPEVTELVLWAKNDAKLDHYLRGKIFLINRLRYHPAMIIEAFVRGTQNAAAAYNKAFGTADCIIFTTEHIFQAALELYQWYNQEYGTNESPDTGSNTSEDTATPPSSAA
jgi:hypothetical protein